MANIAQELVQIDAGIANDNESIMAIDRENAALDAKAKGLREQATEYDAQVAANMVKRKQIREHRESLSRLRASAEVNQRVTTHEEAAAKAREDAEKLTAELAEKNRQADELLAKLKEQAKPE